MKSSGRSKSGLRPASEWVHRPDWRRAQAKTHPTSNSRDPYTRALQMTIGHTRGVALSALLLTGSRHMHIAYGSCQVCVLIFVSLGTSRDENIKSPCTGSFFCYQLTICKGIALLVCVQANDFPAESNFQWPRTTHAARPNSSKSTTRTGPKWPRVYPTNYDD